MRKRETDFKVESGKTDRERTQKKEWERTLTVKFCI